MDMPGGRKIHADPTPLLGGVAIYLGVLIGFLLNLDNVYNLWPVVAGGSLIVVLGVMNDIKEIRARIRLLVQICAALLVVAGGLRISFSPIFIICLSWISWLR